MAFNDPHQPFVIHLIPSIEVGGVEKAIMLSLEKLNQRMDYRVVSLAQPVLRMEEALARKVYPAGGRFPLSVFRALLILQKLKPQILICSLWKTVPVAAVYKIFHPSVPLIGFFHSTRTFHFADRLFLGVLRRIADFIAVDSEATFRIIAAKERTKRFFKIPYIFPQQKNLTKEPHSANTARMIFTGRIVPVKNLPAAFRFVQKLLDRGVDATLDIYGSGETAYINRLKDLIAGSPLEGRVRFCGYFPPSGTTETLARYHFLLQLSDAEGMAMSVVDAMLHGVIPIVTPVGEIPSYLRHMENGIIVELPPENGSDEAADKVAMLCRSKAQYQVMSERCVRSFDNAPDYCGSLEKMLLEVAQPR